MNTILMIIIILLAIINIIQFIVWARDIKGINSMLLNGTSENISEENNPVNNVKDATVDCEGDNYPYFLLDQRVKWKHGKYYIVEDNGESTVVIANSDIENRNSPEYYTLEVDRHEVNILSLEGNHFKYDGESWKKI